MQMSHFNQVVEISRAASVVKALHVMLSALRGVPLGDICKKISAPWKRAERDLSAQYTLRARKVCL